MRKLFLATLGAALLFVALVNLTGLSERLPEEVSAPAKAVGLPFKIAALAAQAPDEELPIPVRGVRVRQVANTWGAARSEGRSHQGQDIFAAKGTPVYSATEGYVTRVGQNRLGGNVVFVVGRGGRGYYYAHLDSFAEGVSSGDYVTPETVLGYVGTTGNASGTPPHLHFGIYGTGGAIDPLPLLVDRTQTRAPSAEGAT